MEGPFSLYKDEADDRNALDFFSGKERRVKRKALYKIIGSNGSSYDYQLYNITNYYKLLQS